MHIIIPARYGSTRFPGKALALLHGSPLVVHVLRRAQETQLGPVYVATDDLRIADAVAQAGGQALLTRADHPSGTDRVAEAVQKLPDIGAQDVIINLQGDEPMIETQAITRLLGVMDDPQVQMATVAAPLDPGVASSEHIVKVVVDAAGRALYFSRARIPWSDRDPQPALRRHLGLYAYRRQTLMRLTALPSCASEQAERLEQLRALHHGIRIHVVDVDKAWGGVDTPEDLAALAAHPQR